MYRFLNARWEHIRKETPYIHEKIERVRVLMLVLKCHMLKKNKAALSPTGGIKVHVP